MMRCTVREHVVEHPARAVDLAVLALSSAICSLYSRIAREVEAEIRLHRLLAEHQARQRAADELHHAGGEAGVEDGDPEQEAGNADAEEGEVHGAEMRHRMIEKATRLVAVDSAWMV